MERTEHVSIAPGVNERIVVLNVLGFTGIKNESHVLECDSIGKGRFVFRMIEVKAQPSKSS